MAVGADYFMMFDDDMRFAPEAFLRLYRHQKDFIGALAFTAREPITPVLYRWEKKWDGVKNRLNLDSEPLMDYPRNSLFKVDAIGTGLVLIKSSVFKTLPSPWFDGHIGAGEDVHMAAQCSRYGIEIWCDSSVKTQHVRNDPVWMDEEHYFERLGETNHESDNSNSDLQELAATAAVPEVADDLRRVPV